MRVAIVTDLPFLCEQTMYLDELQRRLPKIGFEPAVYLIKTSQSLSKLDSTYGIIRALRTSALVQELSKFDIIHVQFTFPLGFTLAALRSIRLLGKPVIIHTHGYDVFTEPSIKYGMRRTRTGRFFASYTWKRSDKIIAVCRNAKSEIEKIVSSNKIDTLYNGVDEVLFTRNTSDCPRELIHVREQADIILLSVASRVPVKNHNRMVQAFEKLIANTESKQIIKLVLIGGNPTPLNDSSYSKDVLVLGKIPHKDLPMYFSMADAFLLPSLSEAHPWSILEAMSCNLPILASNVGGIPETVNNSGLLVNPYDIGDIFNKLECLVTMTGAERARIGNSNRERICQMFTLERHLSNLKGIYMHVLEK